MTLQGVSTEIVQNYMNKNTEEDMITEFIQDVVGYRLQGSLPLLSNFVIIDSS